MRLDTPLTYSSEEHRIFRWGLLVTLVVAFVTRPIHAEDQLFPKGITHVVDLTFLANDFAAGAVMVAAVLAGVVYALGRRPATCLAVMFAATVAIFTFAMSHTTKIRHDTNV